MEKNIEEAANFENKLNSKEWVRGDDDFMPGLNCKEIRNLMVRSYKAALSEPSPHLEIRYSYKGNTYKVVEFGQMKHPEKREWVDAVFYKSELDNKTYCREKSDFETKFIQTKNINH